MLKKLESCKHNNCERLKNVNNKFFFYVSKSIYLFITQLKYKLPV